MYPPRHVPSAVACSRRCLTALGVAITLGLTPVAAPAQRQGPIAVIVNRSNPVSDLSMEELRRLFLGRTTLIGNRTRVALAELVLDRAGFYRVTLGMSEDKVKRHWIGLVFAGEPATPPEAFEQAEAIKRFVAARDGGIGFVPLSEVDPSIKALTIDGLRPNDPSYALRRVP